MANLRDTAPKALLLSRGEKEWLKAHQTVRLGIDPAWPPFEFYDKDHGYSGLAAEYIQKIEARLTSPCDPGPA